MLSLSSSVWAFTIGFLLFWSYKNKSKSEWECRKLRLTVSGLRLLFSWKKLNLSISSLVWIDRLFFSKPIFGLPNSILPEDDSSSIGFKEASGVEKSKL